MIWLKILRNKIVWLILGALVLADFFIWLAIFENEPRAKLKIDFFDVGQGSAIFLSAPGGNQVLIDGGPSDAILTKLGENLPLFDRKIELLILTHSDADHLDGLIEVLKKYEIGAVLETGAADGSANYLFWRELLAEKNVPVVFASLGQTLKIAENLEIKIMAPAVKIVGQSQKSANNSSIVGKIIFGENEILFTGDAEGAEEAQMILNNLDLRSDILAIAHHGGKNSSGADFLAAVAAQMAVIQVGKNNRYGHPAPETLARLKGLEVWRTDLVGDIGFECDLRECLKID